MSKSKHNEITEEYGKINGVLYQEDSPRIPCTFSHCENSPLPHYIMGFKGELQHAISTHNLQRCACSLCYIRRGNRHCRYWIAIEILKKIQSYAKKTIYQLED